MSNNITIKDIKDYECFGKKQIGEKVKGVELTNDELLFGNYCHAIAHALYYTDTVGKSLSNLLKSNPGDVQDLLNKLTDKLNSELDVFLKEDVLDKGETTLCYPSRSEERGETLSKFAFDEDLVEFILLQRGYRLSGPNHAKPAFGGFSTYIASIEIDTTTYYFLDKCEPVTIEEMKNSIDTKIKGPKK